MRGTTVNLKGDQQPSCGLVKTGRADLIRATTSESLPDLGREIASGAYQVITEMRNRSPFV